MNNSHSTFDPVRAMAAAQSAARLGRQVLLDYFGRLTKVSEKFQAGLVSEADVASEKVIQAELQKLYPASFLGEESSADKVSGWPTAGNWWIVDPLDGTTNYVHRFPVFCISIGLMWQGELVLGLVDMPMLNTTYTATKGGGAFRDDQPIQVSTREKIRDTLLATGFFRDEPHVLREQLKIFEKLVFEARGIRRAGAAAYDLCLVAEGVFDSFWEKNLKPWDTAAGTVLVREAGGVVTDYKGQPYQVGAGSILASSQVLHGQMLGHLNSCLSST
ncbi:MAG: inositol monophosphatase [Bdellovibrionales bacterium]